MPRNLIVHPLVLRRVQVIRTATVTPRMKRVTVAGELGSFVRDGIELPAFSTPAFDDHVKLIFASDGDVRSVLPVQHASSIEWPPSQTRQGRDYTPRRFDPTLGELDIDFVLHGQGPAVTWAHTAKIGDELWFAGPKSSTVVPDDSDWSLLVGDETALPAIGRFFEERPVDGSIRAIIVTGDTSARQDLAVGPHDDVKWLVGDAADPEIYREALAAMPVLPGRPYIWAGGESRALLPVRRHAKRLEAPKTHTNITGYWHRRARVEVPSPIPWLAVRAGLQLGIVEAVASGTTVPALAASIGVDAAALEPLIAVLHTADVIQRSGDTIALGTLGSDLAADEHARERFTGTESAEILALSQLAPALRSGTPAWSQLHGTSAVDEAAEELVEQAERLAFVITDLPKLSVWSTNNIAFSGPGAAVLADTISPDTAATIAESSRMLAALQQTSTRHDFQKGWDTHDLVATALALSHRSDAEAVEYLARLRKATSKLIVIDALSLDALGPAVAEQALKMVAVTGNAPRDVADIDRLAARSGWRMVDHRPLGWGISYFEMHPHGEGS